MKIPKKIPNYMKPNAAWLGRATGEEAATQLKEAIERRKITIANLKPDFLMHLT